MASTDIVVKGKNALVVPYAISKAAVNMVVAKYAAEFGDDGFIFLALSPGFVNSHECAYTALSSRFILTGDIAAIIPPEALPRFAKMAENTRKYLPNHAAKFGGAMTPEESATAMLEIIPTLKPEENGLFMSHRRSTEWV